MTNTWNALIAALLLIAFATGCGDEHNSTPAGPAGDSLLGYDLALAPLHFVDAAGRVYELLLAVDAGGTVVAGSYLVDGALFAAIAVRAEGQDADVQIYQDSRAVFRAIVAPAANRPGAADAWPAFAAATAETRAALTTWQGSASGVALGQLHAALSRLTAASAVLIAPIPAPGT